MSDLVTTCRSIKAALSSFFDEHLEVSADDANCLVTLPIKTLDGRYVSIVVERTVGDVVIVHDGRSAVTELFLQGIHPTDARMAAMSAIARHYGVSFADNAFTAATKPERINETILAIAQCTSIAMTEVLRHAPVVEEERAAALVKRTLEQYRPAEVDMRYRVPAKSRKGQREHFFDAVAFPRLPRRNAVAIKTLGTGYNPNVQAKLYGFLALDLEGTPADNWPRLAVISKADRWPEEALKIVREMSARTLELKTGHDEEIKSRLLPAVDELATAA